MRRLALLVSTCGYVGYAPIAPGTFGSAAGLAVLYAVRLSGSWMVELALIVALFAFLVIRALTKMTREEIVEILDKHIAWDDEGKKKYNAPFWASGWYRVRTWRCAQAGLDNLEWQRKLTWTESELGEDNPIIINLQYDYDNSQWYIEFVDKGIGMSPERMENIYSNFFSSTKRV